MRNIAQLPLVMALSIGLIAMTIALLPALAWSQDLKFYQIGTGPAAETRFSLGGLIANALSNPPGSRECDKGGSCGVPGLVAVAKSTQGSRANLELLAGQKLDAALVNADMAFYAYHGTGPFAKTGAIANLRAIAMVSTEALHILVPANSNITELAQLRGKKIAIGEAGTPSHIHAKEILEILGLKGKAITLLSLNPSAAAEAMLDGKIDAMMMVDGQPSPLVSDLSNLIDLKILPIDQAPLAKLTAQKPFLSSTEIRGNIYKGVPDATPTLGIGLALVTNAAQSTDLTYGITRALWHPSTVRTITHAWAKDLGMVLDRDAILKLGIPLHGGAQGYYFDANIAQ